MFRFAANIALLASTERELKEALNVTKTVFNYYNNMKAFVKIPQLVSNMDLEIRKKLLKRYVSSVALYGYEVWTIGKGERRLEASEVSWYGELLKMS